MPIKNGWERIQHRVGVQNQTTWQHKDTGERVNVFEKNQEAWILQTPEDVEPFKSESNAIEQAREYLKNNPIPEDKKQIAQDTMFSIIVPRKYNNSHPIPEEKIENLLQPIAERFGGMTLEPAEGAWDDQERGRIQREEVYRVLIVRKAGDKVPLQEDEAWLRNYAEQIADELGQAQVMVMEDSSMDADFVEGHYAPQ